MAIQNLFQDIQGAIKDRLEADDDFNGVAIFAEELGDPVSMMESKLATTGLAVYIATPSMTIVEGRDNIPGPYFMPINIIVIIYELVPVNRSDSGIKTTAGALALAASKLLHLYVPSGLGQLMFTSGGPSISATIEPESNVLAYRLNLVTHGGIDPN